MRLPRNVIALGLVSFFTDFASSMVMPILPLFVVIVLAEGVDKVGIIGAVTTLISYVLRVLGGVLSDRFDKNKPFLLLGYSISAVSKPLFALAGGVVLPRFTPLNGSAKQCEPHQKIN